MAARGTWALALVVVAGLVDCQCSSCSGCGGNAAVAPAPNARRAPKPLAIDPDWRKCADGDTCVHAPSDCCGCPHGGNDVAVNARFALEAGKARQSSCGGETCGPVRGDRFCGMKAECVAGTCQLVDVSGGLPVAPVTKVNVGRENVVKPVPGLPDVQAKPQN